MKLVRDGRLRLIHGYICGLFGERNIIICFYDTVVSKGRRYRWIQVLYRGPLVEDLRFSEVGWGWYVGILGWGSGYKFSPLRIDNTGAWQISRFLELISN